MRIINKSTGYSYDDTALELACGPSVPDEVITMLAQTSHKLSYRVYNCSGEILMDMNWDLTLLTKIYVPWEWSHDKEHLFHPQKEFYLYSRCALYRLQHNDHDLCEVCVGWPLPSQYALESVVEALACNTSVYRLDIREGDTNLYPEAMEMLDNQWWYGREQEIADPIISCLQ